MEFLIHHNGREIGPYTESEVRTRLSSGAIALSDLAWHEGAPDWKPLSSFEQFTSGTRQTPPPLPSRTESPIPPPPAVNPGSLAPPSPPPALDATSVGPYTRVTLQADERPLHKTTIHWMVLLVPFFGALFFFIIIVPICMFASWKGYSVAWLLLLIPLGIIASAILSVKTSELVITDRRVLIKVGFIQRQTFEMFISKIESVAVVQGMIGKMLDYGTVEIRGTGGSSQSFATIAAPLQFRDAIQLVQSSSERH
ncbi:MAG TPA: PH domain-containing protein [Chthoniobacterales bacterium]|nr:PH domain-containing protein [Chthoniobacterales bacterium]